MKGELNYIKKAIKNVKEDFSKNPLWCLNEREVVSRLHFELLKYFKYPVYVTSKTIPITSKTPRVHQEVTTKSLEDKYKGNRTDLLILKNKKTELVGYSYQQGNPSTVFRDDDVLGAIEVKFYRGKQKGKKQLRKSEDKGMERTINKLKSLKKANKNAYCCLLIFAHSEVRFVPKQEKEIKRWIGKSGIVYDVWSKEIFKS